MKIVIFAFFALILFSSPCFAQGDMEPVTDTQKETGLMSFTGKVESVTTGNIDTGTKSQITLKSEDDNTITFTVDPGMSVMGSEGNMMSLGDIAKGSTATVDYNINPDGTNNVMSIEMD